VVVCLYNVDGEVAPRMHMMRSLQRY